MGRLCKASHRLLAAVAGLDERLLDGALRAAVAGQLLVTRAGGDGYQFRHALLWEVVEAGLLPGERARLHAGYAHALSERPELAAERARGFAEAHAHYQRALALWEQVGDPGRSAGLDRVELLVRAAEAAAFTGQVARAVGLLEDALGRVDLSAEPVRAAVLLARLGEDRRVAGDEAGALAAFSQAEGLVEGAPPSADRAGVLAACAYGLFLSMRSEQAIACAEEAVAAARAVGARAEKAKALRVLAAGLANVGGLDQAVGLVLGARRIAEEVGDAEAVVATYRTACKLLMWAGRARDALQDLQRGYQRAHELGMERADGSFVAGNLAFTLLDTGGWVECERLTREPLVSDTWGAFNLRVCRGMLLARRGEFAAAREQLDLALRLSPPFMSESAWEGLAEFALWAGREDEAAAAVAEGLGWWVERDPDAYLADYSLWYPLARRLEADRAERAAARRAAEEVAEARRRAAPLLAELDRLEAAPPPQARYPYVVGNLLLARAEQSRLEGRSDPDRWLAAAAAWEGMGYPFEAAYARFREAEARLAGGASRARAERALRSAHQTAVALGAGPLRREVELLAQRGRLRLDDGGGGADVAEAPPSPAASLGLTRREAEVLALGAAGRGEAAAIAHRLGLDTRSGQ